jgi:hypothetical protein
MKHPASETKEPSRDPDHMEHSIEIWFNEMVYMYKNSNLQWIVCPMMICPLSGTLMYMAHSWPLCWTSINNKAADESYMRHLVEKEMLGVFDETSK